MQFPEYRARRMRKNAAIRNLVRETTLSTADLIFPLFVQDGKGVKSPIDSLPGQFRYSVDELSAVAKQVAAAKIPAVVLFGAPTHKDDLAKEAVKKDGLVAKAVRAVKEAAPEVAVITDVCVCAYTQHGHCGVVSGTRVDNDPSLELLAEMAIAHAAAGADIVAPSDMMDGRVGYIREALDEDGHEGVAIMAYSAKFASSYYGPFRQAVDSSPRSGDRKTYQMDPANVREAMREVTLDVEEGADIVMIKPALSYLDIISTVRQEFDLPVAAYNVSGEYAMIKAAAERGWIDGTQVMYETLLSIKRAGADMILTYHALEAAHYLAQQD